MEETNNVQPTENNQFLSEIGIVIFILSMLLNLGLGSYVFIVETEEKEEDTNFMSSTSNTSNSGKLYDVSQSVTRVISDDLSNPTYKLVTLIDYKQKTSLINFEDNPFYSVLFIKDLKEVEKVKCIEYEKALFEAQRLYLLNNQKCK